MGNSLQTVVRKVNITSSTVQDLENILSMFEISQKAASADYTKTKPEATFNIELQVYPDQNLEDDLRTMLQNKAPHSNVQIFSSPSKDLATVPYSQTNKIWTQVTKV